MKVSFFPFLILIKTPNLVFISTLIFGTCLACSSSSWPIAWVGLEINLIRFIPLLINKLHTTSIETTIKYFLAQAIASIIVILLAVSCSVSSSLSLIPEINLLLTSSLAIKAGVAPLHFWFPQVIEYARWPQALLILTWQKIAPLVLISFTYNNLIPLIIISSARFGILGGINQTSLKKILTYSSIIHSAWLISLAFIRNSLWWIYFLRYALITISIITPISLLNLTQIKDINLLNLKLTLKLIILINFLSLAGLPPFIGFTIKIISINAIIGANFNLLIILTLILASLISFYFYSRLIYSSWLAFEGKSKIIWVAPKTRNLISSTIFISLVGNIILSFLVFIS